MSEFCPQCKKRVNEWEIAHDKTEFVNGLRVHKACLQDVPAPRVEFDHEEADAMEE